MKNFLSLDNLIFEEKESISNFIQSSSEVSECSITNVLEDNSSSIWISKEELPQEIIINISRSFFKQYPKKLSAIGIYCWHAYPTNPKLVEILISKNNDDNYISFGNFDLCLKPGRQLLQLDEENDTDYLNTENNNYSIKILIKETYGDKRTYINNIYLYENIDFMVSGNINSFNGIETIKEEDDSSSIFYLRESRERTLPKQKKNNSVNNNISSNRINKEINDIINMADNQKQSQSQINSNNFMKKINSDEIKNKDLTIDEFEIITKSKNTEKKLNEQKNNNNNITNENILIKNNYENDESNLNINNNLIGIESQFNITEISEKNNLVKNDDLTNQNILLTKTNDEIDDKLNNSNNNETLDKNNEINENNIDNKINKNNSNNESLDVTLSSDDLESFGILKGTKTHHNNFFNPPKISESNEELDNLELLHSSGGNKHKNKIDMTNKKIMENYFNMQNSSKNSNKKPLKNANCFSQKNIKNDNDNININNKNINIKRKIKKEKNDSEIKKLKNELSTIEKQFETYKKEQEEINKKYQDKINILETHIKKLTINSNKMNEVVKTLLEAQYIQNQTTNDFIMNQMRQIATDTFVNIFSNITQLATLNPQQNNPIISIPNSNQDPIENLNMNKVKEKERQQTYQTTRRKKYSIDKLNKKMNNKSLNNVEISDSKENNFGNKIYNKKIKETNFKANRLKKYNSGKNIILKKNYINQSNYKDFNNPEQKSNYINNDSSDNNNDNIDNIDKEQSNDNYFYQKGYPTEGEKNINPFEKVQKLNNINQDEILKINNNDFDGNLLSNKKDVISKRLLSNYYKKKNSSPIKKIRRTNISYPESNHLYPETTANISNQNKNINFNINENEENDEIGELYSDEDVPLKVSQLKSEKANYFVNNAINRNKEKINYDEEKENEFEIDNETRTNSEVRDTYSNLKKNKQEEIIPLKNNINFNDGSEEKKTAKESDKIINNQKRRIKSKKNESLINLIQQYNNNNKEINKSNNE